MTTFYRTWLANLRANPFVIYEMRRQKFSWRPFKQILTISIFILIIEILFALLTQIIPSILIPEFEIIKFSLIPIGFFLFSSFPYIASSAAETTSQHLKSNFYVVASKSAILNGDILKGCIFSALYRRRSLLLAMAGIMPLTTIHLSIFMAFNNYMNCGRPNGLLLLINCANYLPTVMSLLQAFLNSICVSLLVGSMVFLSSVIGTFASLLLRNHFVAKGLALGGAFLTLAFLTIGLFLAIQSNRPDNFITLIAIAIVLTLSLGALTQAFIRKIH